jgi:hypothetical protein
MDIFGKITSVASVKAQDELANKYFVENLYFLLYPEALEGSNLLKNAG